MKIKTSELIGAALDWAVAQAIGTKPVYNWRAFGMKHYGAWETAPAVGSAVMLQPYSTDWAHGRPLLNRHKISRTINHSGLWIAYAGYNINYEPRHVQCDRSELVAGLRCLVALNLGDEVEIPKELLGELWQ